MLPFSEACERNKQPILDVLVDHLAEARCVLEIGSGTGQHAEYFAPLLSHLTWQPTDVVGNLPAIAARVEAASFGNLLAPLELDVASEPWPIASVDAVFSANSLHIMSWAHVQHFFRGAGRVLKSGGLLCVYGPFMYDGKHTSHSNAAFDVSLRHRDPMSGIRDFSDLQKQASAQYLQFVVDHQMPANNRLLVWKQA